MTRSALFEDFSAAEPTFALETASEDDDQLQRDAFDTGYKQGWSDAFGSLEAEREKAQTNVAIALQETSFTYLEARRHILRSFQPLLESLVKLVLPEIAHRSLCPKILEEFESLSQRVAAPVQLICSERDHEQFSVLIAEHAKFPMQVVVEPTLTSPQAVLRFDGGKSTIDVTSTLATVQSLISEFFEDLGAEDAKHA